jgi:hypothetical protein
VPDPTFLREMVSDDIGDALGRALQPELDDDGFRLRPDFEFLQDAVIGHEDATRTIAVIPWQFTGTHRDEPLLGVPPTGRRVVVNGTTIVRDAETDPQLYRYVDWGEVLDQLGVHHYGRPVVDVVERFGDAITDQPEFDSVDDAP